ncbi:hypothetical protein KY342_04545 [Candidatus Woesearchaeota archaeon]|nr:hypothetical protein [Candidatus Woesearchaeota archaeon]
MKKSKIYDSYPVWMVILINIFVFLVYVSGAYIMFRFNWIAGVIFIVYLVLLEFYIYKEGCIHCFYYGKLCAFGKGAIVPFFFKKGDPKKFCEKVLSFKDFIPQILVILVPLITGIALIVSGDFDIWILIAMLYPLFSWFAINPFIYGKLACPHCKQGTICCPALDFFSKKK